MSCKNNQPVFQQLDAAYTGVYFQNTVKDSDSLNVLTYPYLFNGAGVAVGDINHDGLEDLFFSGNRKGANKLYLNKGLFRFEDITAAAGVAGKSDWCDGVTMVDINGDGWLDIYVSTVTIPGLLNSSNELYINNHNNSFTEKAADYGLDFKGHTTQTAFFDYDEDGDLDCFMLNHAANYAESYKDGSVRKTIDPSSGSKLFQNNNGKFTDITKDAGIYSSSITYGLGVAIGDINNDGWPDIYVSNDFKENDYCYINNRNGTFTERVSELFRHTSHFSMGNDMADFDNDGWPDIITLDMLPQDEKILKASVTDDDVQIQKYRQQDFGFHYQLSRNCLQHNIEGSCFQDIGLQMGVAATDWSWSALFADFDNDGKKDLYIGNGYKYRVNDLDFNNFIQNEYATKKQQALPVNKADLLNHIPEGKVADYFYLNKGEEGFLDISLRAGFDKPSLSSGAVYADLDNDGDLDLIVNRLNEPAGIYKNNAVKKNFLKVVLKGQAGNTEGIGASVYVYSKATMQLYQQSPVRGFMSSVSPVLNIGLDDAEKADSALIIWPGGKGEWLYNIPSNQTITLWQQNAKRYTARPALKKQFESDLSNITGNAGIHFIHKEDAFDDMNQQPLLPHSLATAGPKLSVGDVNGDGLQDFYVCGAKGQSGQLYVQQKEQKFALSNEPAFTADSLFEDTDALFFDADGDGDPDLYVCSGGGEYYGRQPLLSDRLYINDGSGFFTRSKGLPDIYENKSCVKPCDFDNDGDIDLFVGGRADARMFGFMPSSVLLQNNGHGVFTDVTLQLSKGLGTAGMVTDAAWADVDGDGWKDLLVVGEWMPVTYFRNNKGQLLKQENAVANTNGLWQCILPTDINGDGQTDFLIGNWGANSKLKASSEYPLSMYVYDWDNNGETDPILCINKDGREYPFLTKTDLEKRIPMIKKRFLTYSSFAGKTIQEIFPGDALQKARHFMVNNLYSSVLYNNKGRLSLKRLPAFLQAAPLFSFIQMKAENNNTMYMAAGNFYEVQPFEGRYDAFLPARFFFRADTAVLKDYLPQTGAVRQLAPVSLGTERGLLIAQNNDTLFLFQQNTCK